MGHTLDAYGKPVFDDTFAALSDLQAGADFAEVFAWTRGGTNAQRLALLPGKLRNGMSFVETDTGEVFDYTLGAWVRRARVNGGLVSGATNLQGFVTVTHGLRTVPLSVVVNIATSSPVIPTMLKANVETPTASSFRVQILRADQGNAPLAENPVDFYWTAIA